MTTFCGKKAEMYNDGLKRKPYLRGGMFLIDSLWQIARHATVDQRCITDHRQPLESRLRLSAEICDAVLVAKGFNTNKINFVLNVLPAQPFNGCTDVISLREIEFFQQPRERRSYRSRAMWNLHANEPKGNHAAFMLLDNESQITLNKF